MRKLIFAAGLGLLGFARRVLVGTAICVLSAIALVAVVAVAQTSPPPASTATLGSKSDATWNGADAAPSIISVLKAIYNGIANSFTTLQSIQGQSITACTGTPVASATIENSHVIDASPGKLCDLIVDNWSGTAGWVLVFDATTAPADGAVTPKRCFYLPAIGTSALGNGLGNADIFATGIVVVLSSGNGCFTKATGTITGFISGKVL